jgi:hypothetical protein
VKIETRNWFQDKREGSVLLKLSVINKGAAKIKLQVQIYHDCAPGQTPNVLIPLSQVFEVLYKGGDSKALIHLQKIRAYEPWTPLRVTVVSVDKNPMIDQSNGNQRKLNSLNIPSL